MHVVSVTPALRRRPRFRPGRVNEDFRELAGNNWNKPFVAGVIDVKSTVTESGDGVADRIRQVLEYVSAIDSDCPPTAASSTCPG